MLLDAYDESTNKALDAMGARPLEPEKPKPKHSGWSTLPRFVGAAVSEIGGNLMDVAGAYGQATAIQYRGNPLVGQQAQQQAREAYEKLTTEGLDWRNPNAAPAYEYARGLYPDPQTAGMAEQVVFQLGKGLTKAIGAGLLFGPAGGAATYGTSEGMTTAEELATKGVDKETRTKVGLVRGAVSVAEVALPLAGKTIGQTAALVGIGGPGLFMAEQGGIKAILDSADYHALAQQYDPLDPTGLLVSTLIPAGFGAWALRGGRKPSARPVNGAEAAKAQLDAEVEQQMIRNDIAIRQAATPEQVDAAMVHHLTVARDALERADPATVTRMFDEAEPQRPSERAEQPESVTPSGMDDATHLDAMVRRAEEVTQQLPDMPVVLKDDGTHARAADEIEAIRRQAMEGADDELGALDADLIRVAADCLLS